MHAQGKYVFSDGEYQFETQEWRNAFSYLVNLVKEDLATEEVISYVFHDAGRFFGMGKCAYVPFLVNSYQMKYETEFPTVQDDWAMQVPPKWGPDDPQSYHSTGLSTGGIAVPVHIKENEKAAVRLLIDYLRSEEAKRNEVVVEGNESTMFSVYDDPQATQKVDWDLADRAADIIKKPHPKRVEEIPNSEVRKQTMKYARAEVFPAGFPEVRAQIDENYIKAATGQISVDQAIQNIIDYVAQF
jgi:ABC-type glycerol-3-phosphate transport system substrate-binding protein